MKKKGISKKDFEEVCMSVIDMIVSLDAEYTRSDAIEIARMLVENGENNNAFSKRINEEAEKWNLTEDEKSALCKDVFLRVLNEFQIASDEEYTLLRSLIFN